MGTFFLLQITLIFLDMLNVYRYTFRDYYFLMLSWNSVCSFCLFFIYLFILIRYDLCMTFQLFNRMYSELISSSIAEGGPFASKTSYVKLLRSDLLWRFLKFSYGSYGNFIILSFFSLCKHRSVKRETLKLIETFLDKAEDQPQTGKQFVPPMMDRVLLDYARNLPDARESEVLSLFATIINKYVTFSCYFYLASGSCFFVC